MRICKVLDAFCDPQCRLHEGSYIAKVNKWLTDSLIIRRGGGGMGMKGMKFGYFSLFSYPLT